MNHKRVLAAFLFPNGMIVAVDAKGNQIPELQGSYSIERHQRILLESLPDCDLNGFNTLPNGFIKTATDYADFWNSKNMSWEEIQAL